VIYNNFKNFLDILNKKKIIYGPCIETLCKDQNYKEVGNFLLNKLFNYLKNKYEKIYLVPESIFYKNNKCSINKKKYLESNSKLINYYKKIGFNLSENLYSFEICEIYNDNSSKVIFFNVMYKKLK